MKLGEWRYHADLSVKVLDVGQGQCVLLASGGEFTLVDCGSGNSWYGSGEIASQHLRAMGCWKLDRLILTHYDSDHINGVRSLMARMDVNTLIVPELADDGPGGEVLELARTHGVTVKTVEDKMDLSTGSAVLTVLTPEGDGEDNERGTPVLA